MSSILSAVGDPSRTSSSSEFVVHTDVVSNNNNNSLPNSCSLIFSTAASFNINQQDTVIYARESIRLLAKSLAMFSEHAIIQQLYAYAPDNLAWLWAFFDWESALDLSRVPCQDTYRPLGWLDSSVSSSPSSSPLGLADEHLNTITRIYAEAPLIQYKYRQELMIGDLYKFLEHVQNNVSSRPIAISLFVLYFPRFAAFIDSSSASGRKLFNPKILSSNVALIGELDAMLVKLIGSRYNYIREHKQRIFAGPHGLPSYVSQVLTEMNFWSCATPSARFLMSMLSSGMVAHHATSSTQYSPPQTSRHAATASSSIVTASPYLVETTTNNNNNNNRMNTYSTHSNNVENFLKTLNYLKLLQKSNKINFHLDHDSFDERTNPVLSSCYEDEVSISEHHHNHHHNHSMQGASSMSPPPTLSPEGSSSPNEQQAMMDLLMSNLNLASTTTTRSYDDVCGGGSELLDSYDAAAAGVETSIPPALLPPTSMWTAATSRSLLMNTPQTPKTQTSSSCSGGSDGVVWPPCGSLVAAAAHAISMQPTPPPSATKTSVVNEQAAMTSYYEPTTTRLNYYQDEFHHHAPLPTTRHHLINDLTFKKRHQQQQQTSSVPSVTMITSGGGHHHELSINTNTSPTLASSSSIFSPGPITSPRNFSSYNQQYTPNRRNHYSTASAASTSIVGAGYLSPNTSQNHQQQHHLTNTPTIMSSVDALRAWYGQLPPKMYPLSAVYSRKVFLGGLPWDLNQNTLVQALFKYGSVRLEIPGKDSKHPRVAPTSHHHNNHHHHHHHRGGFGATNGGQYERTTPGYVYVIFDQEMAVTRLLADCRRENRNGGEHFFFNIYIPPVTSSSNQHYGATPSPSRQQRGKLKEVEVIPWNLEDTSFVPALVVNNSGYEEQQPPPSKIDPALTVFVGGVHGMCNARGLAKVMADVFGEVVHAALDVDKYKYPIGSGRVTFRNRQSYANAIKTHFVNIKANQEPTDPTPKFEKNIQIEPYLDESSCSKCDQKATLFCRNETCLENFCKQCWTFRHDQTMNGDHIAIARQTKPNNSIN